jgi:hypothetical protein
MQRNLSRTSWPPQEAIREAKQALELTNCPAWIDVMDDGHAQFMG